MNICKYLTALRKTLLVLHILKAHKSTLKYFYSSLRIHYHHRKPQQPQI